MEEKGTFFSLSILFSQEKHTSHLDVLVYRIFIEQLTKAGCAKTRKLI